jgi:uncharacterized protein (DUF2147 family)
MNKSVSLITAALAMALAPTPALAASPLEGLWTNPKGNVVVRIAPCGQQLCGRVVKATAKARAKAAEQGTQNLMGKTLLSGLQPNGPNRWRGKVFVPRVGRNVSGNLTLAGPSRLNVQGCLVGVICKSQSWTRVG